MLPQAAPRGPGHPRPLHFTYVETGRGKSWPAYLAAHTQWLWVHPSRQTKPCMKEITNGEVGCPHCDKFAIPVVKGMVGLYRQSDSKPVLVWVNEDERDKLDRMALHTRVHVQRETTKGSPISILPCLDPSPKFVTALPEKMVWADTSVSVLKLLKDPMFIEWYQTCWVKSDSGVSLAPGKCEPTNVNPTPVDVPGADVADDVFLLGSSFFGKLPADQQDEIRKRRNEAFKREVKEPKTNGKH